MTTTPTIKVRKNGKLAVNGGATILAPDGRFLCGAYLTDEQVAAVKAFLG